MNTAFIQPPCVSPRTDPTDPQPLPLHQAIAYARAGKSGPGEAELKAKLATEPADHDTRAALAALYAGKKSYREAREVLLEIVPPAKARKDGEARMQMLNLFNNAEPGLVSEYRKKL